MTNNYEPSRNAEFIQNHSLCTTQTSTGTPVIFQLYLQASNPIYPFNVYEGNVCKRHNLTTNTATIFNADTDNTWTFSKVNPPFPSPVSPWDLVPNAVMDVYAQVGTGDNGSISPITSIATNVTINWAFQMNYYT